MWDGIRYTLRTLARAPGFTAVALLTLALGIGANTAIFSLVREVILKPLPLREPSRLVSIWDTYFPFFPKLGVSPLELAALEGQTDLFEQTAWYRYVPRDLNLLEQGVPAVQVHATFVSPALLPLLGVTPDLGRGFSSGESSQSVLVSDQIWKRRFGGDLNVVSQSMRLGDDVFSIAGVMPPEFNFPQSTDAWLPPCPLLGDELTNPLRHALGFIVRLRAGIHSQQAAARVETLFRKLAEEHPKTSKTFGVLVAGLQEDLTPTGARLCCWSGWGRVGLIDCLQERCQSAAVVGGEPAQQIRGPHCFGARAGRVVRQLLTESVVLSVLGALLGLIVAKWSLDALSPVRVPLRSWVFCWQISVVFDVLFGLTPALELRKVDRSRALKRDPRELATSL